MKFRKKPVVIEAVQWTGDNIFTIKDFVGTFLIYNSKNDDYFIKTLEGNSYFLREGDWIIRGVEGEFYPCKPDIFDKTYDKVL